MPLPSDFSSPLLLLRENPKAVLEALRMGRIESMDAAGDRITDLHVLYALKSGLLAEAAASFPDPRAHPEIPAHVLLTASIAAAFQGEYALRETGCALHSPAILAELGLNAAWLAPGEGLSRRGTETQALFHGDTLRKLLYQIAAADHDAGRRLRRESTALVERDGGAGPASPRRWGHGGLDPGCDPVDREPGQPPLRRK